VDRAPLPPHERSWRHPSELGPTAEHEPTSTSGRVLIVTTATLSLLLIGLLAVSVTPGRGADPVAVESTTDGATSGLAPLEQPPLPMVTPLGDDGWAVTTSAAVGLRSGSVAARLPSGDVVDVEVVRRDAESGITLVSLPTATHGYQLAASSPEPSDTVLVHGAELQIVTMFDVGGLDVAEGTPVLDGAGALVGICAKVADGMAVITVSTMPGTPGPTSTTTPRSTTTTPVVTAIATVTTVPAPTSGAPSPTTIASTTLPATASTPPGPVSTTAPATSPISGAVASTTGPG
jgi:hypothetical protein